MTCVVAHFNDDCRSIGTGHRIVFVVGTPGRKWVKVFYPAGLTTARLPVKLFEDCTIRECTKREASRVVKMMKRTAKEYDMLGLRYSKKTVKEIRKAYNQ